MLKMFYVTLKKVSLKCTYIHFLGSLEQQLVGGSGVVGKINLSTIGAAV